MGETDCICFDIRGDCLIATKGILKQSEYTERGIGTSVFIESQGHMLKMGSANQWKDPGLTFGSFIA